MTLGSLFDGIAGFPLAAERQGIKTVWISEIEANCIEIAKRHFPDAENLGDITEIDGGSIPAVDIISFGSPCQDLSVAGGQKGLDGARSGLFMEAVRIVREMRKRQMENIQSTLYGKMWPGLFQAIKAKISAGSWKKSQKATFQCLKVENGQMPEWLELREQGGGSVYRMADA